MRTNTRKTVKLGELVVAAFDQAARASSNPREVARLATRTVQHVLRDARRVVTPSSPARSRVEVHAIF